MEPSLVLQFAPAPPVLELQWLGPAGPLPALYPTDPLPTVPVAVAVLGEARNEGYEHTQSSPSAEWVVNHNLGYRPSVTVLTQGGVEVLTSPLHMSNNQVRVQLASPLAGTAHCI